MAEVVVCSHCAAQLALPQDHNPDDLATCPICDQTFPLDSATTRRLPEASLLARSEKPASEERVEAEGVGESYPVESEASLLSERSAENRPKLQNSSPGVETVADSPWGTQPSLDEMLKKFRNEREMAVSNAPTVENLIESPEQDAAPKTGNLTQVNPSPLEGDFDTSFELPSGDEGPELVETSKPEPRPILPDNILPSARCKQRPRKSALRQLAGVVGGGVIGLSLGYYLLLWALHFMGRTEGDPLDIARYLPAWSLPSSHQQPDPSGASSERSLDETPRALASDLSAPRFDNKIAPARFESPSDASSALEGTPPLPEATPNVPIEPKLSRIAFPRAPYSHAELVDALHDANQAREALSQDSLAQGAQAKTIGNAYGTLCQLAQVLTFLDQDHSHPDMAMRRLEAQDIYQRLFVYSHARSDSRQIGARWFAWEKRPHGGIFFAGLPDRAHQRGDLFEYSFPLNQETQVVVVTDQAINPNRFAKATEMGVVGCIIEKPRERIQGYEGDAERVVWATRTISLGPATQRP